MNDNTEQKVRAIEDKNFANPLDKCGLQVAKCLTINIDIASEEAEKENGD